VVFAYGDIFMLQLYKNVVGTAQLNGDEPQQPEGRVTAL
jgi:hypothetical protein